MLVYQRVGPPKIPKSKGALMDLHGPGGSCKPGLKLAAHGPMIKKTHDFAQTSQSNLKLLQKLSVSVNYTPALLFPNVWYIRYKYMDVSWNRPTPIIQLVGIPPLMVKKNISFVYPSDIPLNQWPFQEPIDWRFLAYIRPIFKGDVRGYSPKIWSYTVLTYLHLRILEFPLIEYH